jgi:hypothetical protein
MRLREQVNMNTATTSKGCKRWCTAGGESTDLDSEPGTGRAPRGRVLNDAQRRRREAQEATALKMQVAEENVKDAIIAVQWPLQVRAAAPRDVLPLAVWYELCFRASSDQ